MIKLVNGRGQLGEEIRKKIQNWYAKKDVYIYHTWDPWHRDAQTQEGEYKKFVDFVQSNSSDRIILISTCSQNEDYYVRFKHMAESFLISKCKDCLVIRLPNLVGNKGILKRFKDGTALPYGNIELLTLASAAEKIIDLISYDGLVKTFSIKGEEVSAVLINEIIKKTVACPIGIDNDKEAVGDETR